MSKKQAAKTAGKAEPKPVPRGLRPFKPGPDSRRNTTVPGPGRPPDEFKRRMAAIASGDKQLKALEEIAKDKGHPDFLKALAFAADRGYGKAQQHVDVTTGGQPITVVSGVPEAE